jgi:hypothetical protein
MVWKSLGFYLRKFGVPYTKYKYNQAIMDDLRAYLLIKQEIQSEARRSNSAIKRKLLASISIDAERRSDELLRTAKRIFIKGSFNPYTDIFEKVRLCFNQDIRYYAQYKYN